ncbi:MAG TPA: hypothetical protein DCK98_00320 [Chloroflexi bacterium]|nr:hypothetical protein [Chloroflexota bacterium]HAL27957.1 hypothetical protein [Chloroflexota bacterium]
MKERWVAISLGGLAVIGYVIAGWGAPTVYDYYGRLADAFVHGRYWLLEDPPWLNELLSCGDGKWCVAYPPLPALLSIPLLAFGTATAQDLVSQICGGASAGVLYLALRAYGAPRSIAITGALLSAFGTTLLFTSADGRSWYAAHAVAMLFTTVAFLIAARGGPAWGVGAAIGLAALARLPVAAAAPALALLVARRSDVPVRTSFLRVVAGGLPFLLVYVGYNVLRWGTVTDAGYARLTDGDFFFDHGLFSVAYIPRHLYAIFMEPPDLVPNVWYFLRPRFVGMSLFLVTPALLFVFAGLQDVRRSIAVAATALAAGLALLPDITHGTVGFAQLGYRFSIDAQPFLIALALGGDALRGGVWRSRPSILFLIACAIAVLFNVYAAIAIIRYGYWQ